jgi:hypothetical protein
MCVCITMFSQALLLSSNSEDVDCIAINVALSRIDFEMDFNFGHPVSEPLFIIDTSKIFNECNLVDLTRDVEIISDWPRSIIDKNTFISVKGIKSKTEIIYVFVNKYYEFGLHLDFNYNGHSWEIIRIYNVDY